MATSLPMPNESTSIKPSSLQEQESDEYTSLLGSNLENNATRTSEIHPAFQSHGQDARRSVDVDATGASESIHGKPDPKLATGIVGIISVLLLGTLSPIPNTSYREPLCSHSWAGYRCLHRERRYHDCSCNVQHDLVGVGKSRECELARCDI